MKTWKLLSAAGLILSAFIAIDANASPAHRGYWSGSTFFIEASNSEDRAYNCSFSYTANYMEYGDPKSQPFSGTFHVRPKWSGVVHQSSTSWTSPSTANLVVNCTAVA